MECCDFPPLGLPQWSPRFCTTPNYLPIVVQQRGNHPHKGGGVSSVCDSALHRFRRLLVKNLDPQSHDAAFVGFQYCELDVVDLELLARDWNPAQ